MPPVEQQPNGLWHVHNRHGGSLNVKEADIGARASEMLRIEPGDRLWVRETWGGYRGAPTAKEFADGVPVFYRADPEDAGAGVDVWRPSIHMPRWASRITLLVTGVKVERLQDISGEDAQAEGVCIDETLPEDIHRCWLDLDPSTNGADWLTSWDAKDVFRQLWHTINGPGAWEQNPWVAAYTFTPVLSNIDALGEVG